MPKKFNVKRIIRSQTINRLLIIPALCISIASCGGGDSNPSDNTVDSSSSEGTEHLLAASNGTVPGSWIGRKPTTNNSSTSMEGADYMLGIVDGTGDVNPPPTNIVVKHSGLPVYSDRAIVYLKNKNSFQTLNNLAKHRGWKVIGSDFDSRQYTIQLNNTSNIKEALVILRYQDFISSASPARKSEFTVIDDAQYTIPFSTAERHLESISIESAWHNLSGEKVHVGIIDGGFRLDNPDVPIASFDYYVDNPSVSPDSEVKALACEASSTNLACRNHTHGMHVAGIIGATPNNQLGTAGTGGYSTVLHAYKSDLTTESASRGFKKLAARGAKVVNMSFAWRPCQEDENSWQKSYFGKKLTCPTGAEVKGITVQDVSSEVDFAYEAVTKNPQTLFVQGSGNDGDMRYDKDKVETVSTFLSGFFATAASNLFRVDGWREKNETVRQSTLIVGSFTMASNGSRSISPFTQTPAPSEDEGYPFILAPGEDVVSAGYASSNLFIPLTGTSMAAPHVSGVAAMIFQILPTATPLQVRNIILETADNQAGAPWAPGDKYKYLNAGRAVSEANRLKQKKYELVRCGTWNQCRDKASALGGKLATIRSKTENDWIVTNVLPKADNDYGAWIGLNDATPPGIEKWQSGEAAKFRNWAAGEPTRGTEHYAHIYSNGDRKGQWNDLINDPSGLVSQAIVEYPESGKPNYDVLDDFSAPSLNSARWNVSGYPGAPTTGTVTIDSEGLAKFGAWGAIDTKWKVSLSGKKIVLETRMGGVESRLILTDLDRRSAQESSIMLSNTPYCGWGLNIQALGRYQATGANGGCGASIPVPSAGNFTTELREYRLSIDGEYLTAEAGPTLSDIKERITLRLGAGIAGRSFYITLGTGSDAYSPGEFDWIRENIAAEK